VPILWQNNDALGYLKKAEFYAVQKPQDYFGVMNVRGFVWTSLFTIARL